MIYEQQANVGARTRLWRLRGNDQAGKTSLVVTRMQVGYEVARICSLSVCLLTVKLALEQQEVGGCQTPCSLQA